MSPTAFSTILLCLLAAGGCVRQKLTVTSDPPGALVTLNDREFGRTPITGEFTWYGKYVVQLRKEGYETLDTERWVTAPWWMWVPLDLVAQMFPLTDHQNLSFTMVPTTGSVTDPEQVLERAAELRGRLDE